MKSSDLIITTLEVGSIVPILCVRKLRYREVK